MIFLTAPEMMASSTSNQLTALAPRLFVVELSPALVVIAFAVIIGILLTLVYYSQRTVALLSYSNVQGDHSYVGAGASQETHRGRAWGRGAGFNRNE